MSYKVQCESSQLTGDQETDKVELGYLRAGDEYR